MKLVVLALSLLSLSQSSLAQEASYAPTFVTCPTNPLITRSGSPLAGTQQLDPAESAFINNRRTTVSPGLWSAYLSDNSTGATGYNVSQLVSASNLPKLASAVSGGGLRAALYGAGTLSALDSRNASHAGPLLQLSDYVSGLSGGSWIVGSLAMSGFVDLYSLVLGLNGQPGWLLPFDILNPGGTNQTLSNKYYEDLLVDVGTKAAFGFPVSLEDVWGRAIAYHFFNGTNAENFYVNSSHSNGLLFSSIKLMPNFASSPFPIVVTTSDPSATFNATNPPVKFSNTQFEFTPFTFGSFDPTLQAHVPVEFAGTFLSNGTATTSCVNGYENAGFVLGSSAALFNEIAGSESNATATLINTLDTEIASFQKSNDSTPLVANWPNSFYNFVPSSDATFESSGDMVLQLTDGAEDGEDLPLGPLLVKSREIDTIIAIDGGADDAQNWPVGVSIIATSARTAGFKNFASFPPVPETTDVYVSQGLNVRPTFFGCNTTFNGTTSAVGNYPLLVWLPNAPSLTRTFLTNTSTFQLAYNDTDAISFLDAAHGNALKGLPAAGQTSDPEWPLCLKCATVERARKRAGLSRTAACQSCLTKYCWAGDTTVESAVGTSSNNGGGSGGGSKGGFASTLSGKNTALMSGLSVLLAMGGSLA